MIGLQHRIFAAILLFCLFISTESRFSSARTIITRCIRNTICREFVSTTLGIGIGIGIDEAVEAIFDSHEDPLKDFFPITVTLKNSEFTVTRDEFTASHFCSEIQSYVDWKVEYICFFAPDGSTKKIKAADSNMSVLLLYSIQNGKTLDLIACN